MSQQVLDEAVDIISRALLAVRPSNLAGPEYFRWAQDRARNATAGLTLLLCPEGQCRGPVPTDEEYADETRIK